MINVEKAIIVRNVSKKYKLYNNTKERIFDLFSRKDYGEEHYALKNVNFEAHIGEVVGFIGINGSGKSTLSNIIAGIVPQNSGTVTTNGDVSLIAVAAGLKNDLTGRDNIELKLLMLGFNKQEIREMEQDIIDFSELGKFIDQPVKSYSSGMKSRLGFAISVKVDPDILIIDEALSVGDKAFAEKSLEKMQEFKENGKTMIFVSHSISQMKKFCDKILWLEFGKVKEYGDTNVIIPRYESFIDKWKKLSKEERDLYRENALNNNMQENERILKEVDSGGVIKVRPISRLGKIRKGDSVIYPTIDDFVKGIQSKKYQNAVYYIKKSASINGETYYLISTLPSAIEGVIGWIHKSDISSYAHVAIDEDEKIFYVNGKGKSYDKPWGSIKNIVIDDLNVYKGHKFIVEKTDIVGKSLWYYGNLNGNKMWILHKYLSSESVK